MNFDIGTIVVNDCLPYVITRTTPPGQIWHEYTVREAGSLIAVRCFGNDLQAAYVFANKLKTEGERRDE